MGNLNWQTFYCKLDSFDATQEFGELSCVRLVGVKAEHFSRESFDKGVNIFILDIPENDRFCFRLRNSNRHGLNLREKWIEVTYCVDNDGYSQLYSGFRSDSENGSLSQYDKIYISQLSLVEGLDLIDFEEFQPPQHYRQKSNYEMVSFLVGQGMATLIHNGSTGYLFDAGAGTPIKRPNYLKLPTNDLIKLTGNLKLTFFLSHGDSDHWRLLGWDPIIRNRIQKFVVPNGLKSIGFFDSTVKSRVSSISSDSRLQLSRNAYLNIYRTKPVRPRSNNDGIVACFEKAGQKALIAGDCVYTELSKDGNVAVKNLVNYKYDAIVVPHHGDKASANFVPLATSKSAKAFFSAGNHSYYRHPSSISINEHKFRGYSTIVDKLPSGIIGRIML